MKQLISKIEEMKHNKEWFNDRTKVFVGFDKAEKRLKIIDLI